VTKYPNELKYSKEHEWVKETDDVYTIGITDYAAEQLGDIVHLELPQPGDEFGTGDAFGVVESVKSVSDAYMPVAGRIAEVNEVVINNPGVVNDDPYAEGWIIKIAIEDKSEIDNLMTAQAYEAFIAEES
jgi:glycine cleavage system H protein